MSGWIWGIAIIATYIGGAFLNVAGQPGGASLHAYRQADFTVSTVLKVARMGNGFAKAGAMLLLVSYGLLSLFFVLAIVLFALQRIT